MSTKIAPLLAVAIQFGVPGVPSFKKAVIKDPIGRLGSLEVKFSRGEMFGLEGPCSVTLVKLTWYKKKPVAPGSTSFVQGSALVHAPR